MARFGSAGDARVGRGECVRWRFRCAGINRYEAENAKFKREMLLERAAERIKRRVECTRTSGAEAVPFRRPFLESFGTALRLDCWFLGWPLEQLRIDRWIELQRCVLRRTRVLAILLVVAREGNVQAVHRLPIVQVGFTLHRLTLAEGSISLF